MSDALGGRDIRHLSLLFKVFDLLPNGDFHVGRQRDHPINKTIQIDDQLPIIAQGVQPARERELGERPLRVVVPGLLCRKMSQHHRYERIGIVLQLITPLRVVQQLNDWKAKLKCAVPQRVSIARWPPRRAVIAEDSQTNDWLPVAVVDPVVVDIHPLGKADFVLALHFDMHIHKRPLAA